MTSHAAVEKSAMKCVAWAYGPIVHGSSDNAEKATDDATAANSLNHRRPSRKTRMAVPTLTQRSQPRIAPADSPKAASIAA